MNAQSKIPECIGIILDGNRRWAKANGLTSLEGHKKGFDNVEPIVKAARDMGVAHVVVYAFSTENWNRSKDEVSYLLEMFETLIRDKFSQLAKENIAVRFAGQRERFSKTLQQLMKKAEKGSPRKPQLTLWICLSYGGRAEIVQAARKAARARGGVTEKTLAKHLWTAGMPDPDIIIRTSGEQRLSNFLLWQCAYSELFFVHKHWPAFMPEDLVRVVSEFNERERRHGK